MTFSSIYIILLTAAFFQPSQNQDIKNGPCLNIEAVKDFDVDKFEGRWFEYASTPKDSEMGKSCRQYVRYPPKGNRWPISFLYKENGSEYNMTYASTIIGSGKDVNDDGLEIIFVHVNYKRLALVYACQPQPNNTRKENVWFLTRQQYPSPVTILELYIYALVLKPVPIYGLKVQNQIGCPVDWKDAQTVN